MKFQACTKRRVKLKPLQIEVVVELVTVVPEPATDDVFMK
jgi:hypothetical protein